MSTLREEAAKLVVEGITTFQEMVRLIYTVDMEDFGEE